MGLVPVKINVAQLVKCYGIAANVFHVKLEKRLLDRSFLVDWGAIEHAENLSFRDFPLLLEVVLELSGFRVGHDEVVEVEHKFVIFERNEDALAFVIVVL